MQPTTVVASANPPPAPAASFNDEVFLRLNMRALAQEVAVNFYTPAEVMRRFGLNPAQGALLARHKPFRGMVREERQIWQGSPNATERTRRKIQEAFSELLIDELVGISLDQSQTTANRLEAMKLGAKMGGFLDAVRSDREGGGAGIAPFSINIHLDGKTTRITAAAPAAIEGQAE